MATAFHLFTYGTLTPQAGAASERMQECERLRSAAVPGTLYDAGPYPALVLGGTDRVTGEIWRCPAHVLRRLDRYEAVDEGLFRRVAARVDGVACWLYIAGPRLGPRLTQAHRIATGAWRG